MAETELANLQKQFEKRKKLNYFYFKDEADKKNAIIEIRLEQEALKQVCLQQTF